MHNHQCPCSKVNMLQNYFKQECIPVGLIPPASVRGGGGVWLGVSAQGWCLPGGVCLGGWVFPGGCLPGRCLPKGCGCLPGWAGLPRGVSATPLPVDRHTPVKILPCPKLCLRAVMMLLSRHCEKRWSAFFPSLFDICASRTYVSKQ